MSIPEDLKRKAEAVGAKVEGSGAYQEAQHIAARGEAEAQSFKTGAERVREKIQSEHRRPLPNQGVRPGRGSPDPSNVLPGLGHSPFGLGHSPFGQGSGGVNFSQGTSVRHGQTRGSTVDFGHGTAVDVRALNNKKFGTNDGVVDYAKPIFKKAGRR